MIVKAKKIYTEDGLVDGFFVVEDGKVAAIEKAGAGLTADVNAGEDIIISGIFDTHNHGTMGYAIVKELGDYEESIKGYLQGLAAQGVTAILPTFYPDSFKVTAQAASKNYRGAKIVGLHSEGPYLSRVGENDVDFGHPDIDLNDLAKMVDDCEGMLRLMGIAPELEGATEAIHYLVKQGVRVAFTHSDLDYGGAMQSFREGITVSTHTANVMSGIHHRRMGGLGACLLDPDLWCEIICDGLHVNDPMMEIMFRVKSYDKFIMVSDNTPLAGAPVGRYDLGFYQVMNVDEEGFCLNDTGALCGSTKPVIYGIAHLVKALKIPMEACVKMASLNPAIAYGIADTKGSLKVGKDADFVIIDEDFKVKETYVEGVKVYDYRADTDVFNQAFLQMCKVA